MSDLKEAIKLILGLIAVAGVVWAYLHLLAFLKERGIRLGRYDAARVNNFETHDSGIY